MTERDWDKLLKIKTGGRDDSGADPYRYPYEPTDYCVLERLAGEGLIGKKDVLIDYGCGKGRVSFFLSYQTKARCIGIEYDGRIYEKALENQRTALCGSRTEFVLGRAENYELPPEVNRCYFFNPFSVEILHRVLAKILGSYYAHPREMLLFFYYPSNNYIDCLLRQDALRLYGEIDCSDLFGKAPLEERILIFSLPGIGE